MSKEVILMTGVEGLGEEGAVVRVAEGYARNYLLPRKLAAPVTEAARRRIEKSRQEREEQHVRETAGARDMARRLEQASCTIAVKTGEGGKMFGSVSVNDIVNALKEQGVTLEKKQVLLGDPIRELGVFQVPVKLHPDVETTLKVWVVEE